MMNQVPYARLERARAIVQEKNPDAVVKAYWTPASECEINCEVWRGQRADVVGVNV